MFFHPLSYHFYSFLISPKISDISFFWNKESRLVGKINENYLTKFVFENALRWYVLYQALGKKLFNPAPFVNNYTFCAFLFFTRAVLRIRKQRYFFAPLTKNTIKNRFKKHGAKNIFKNRYFIAIFYHFVRKIHNLGIHDKFSLYLYFLRLF